MDTHKSQLDPSIYTGTVSAFKQAGFKEVARYSPTRPIFRFVITSLSRMGADDVLDLSKCEAV